MPRSTAVDGDVLEVLADARRAGVALALRHDGRLDYVTASGEIDGELRARLGRSQKAIADHLALVAGKVEGHPNTRMATASEARMWFLHMLDPESTAYVIPSSIRTSNPVVASHAMRVLVARHPALHSRYRQVGNWPWRFEQVGRPKPPLLVEFDDDAARMLDDGDLHAMGVTDRRFRLDHGPAIAAVVAPEEQHGSVLAIAAHHIAVDAASNLKLHQSLLTLSEQIGRGLPVQPVGGGEPTKQDRAPRREYPVTRVDEDWLARLRNAGDPLGGWRRDDIDWRVAPVAAVEVALTQEDSSRIARSIGSASVSPFALCAGVVAMAVGRAGGLDRLAVGFAADTRDVDEEDLVGLFVNTAVAVIDLPDNGSWRGLLEHAGEAVMLALDHRAVGFDRLAGMVDPERTVDRSPVTPLLITVNTEGELASYPGETTAEVCNARCELDITVTWTESGIRARLRYPEGLLPRATIEGVADSLVDAFVSIGRDVDGLIESRSGPLVWHGAEESNVDRPERVIVDNCRNLPDAIAVADGVTQLTRRQMLAEALDRAAVLSDQVDEGDRVAVLLDRDVDLVPTLLATWFAGASYVPLDHRAPPARHAAVIEASGAKVLIAGADGHLPSGTDRLALGHVDSRTSAWIVSMPPKRSLDAEAYVLFTSGSTGEPKGVSLRHRGLWHFLNWAVHEFGESLDRVLAGTGLSFDLSVFELFAPLFGTGSVRVVPSVIEPGVEPSDLGCSLVNTVPSVLRAVSNHRPFDLQGLALNLAGEPLRRADIESSRGRPTTVRNLYGPSEVTTYATMDCLDLTAPGEPTIGEPLPHVGAFIASPRLDAVGPGVRGELVLSGSAVADGYVGDPRLTAERFRPDPYGVGGRIYLTGDIAAWTDEGLVFHGRRDRQVKLAGQRVELDEIETWLARYPSVRAAAVVRSNRDRGAVVGYIETTEQLSEAELREWLTNQLPAYALCDRLVFVDSLPMNLNGKVDHSRLAELEIPRRKIVEGPQDSIESELARCWAAVLDAEDVDVEKAFFELGGDSLLLLPLQLEVSKVVGADVALIDLLTYPTVRSFAEYLRPDLGKSAVATTGRGSRRRRALRRRSAKRAEVNDG